jgi:alpha-glucosidase
VTPRRRNWPAELELLQSALHAARALGGRTTARILEATARDATALLRRRIRGSRRARLPALAPGPLRSVEALPCGARMAFERAELEVVVHAAAATLTWRPGRLLGTAALAAAGILEQPVRVVGDHAGAPSVHGSLPSTPAADDEHEAAESVVVEQPDGSVRVAASGIEVRVAPDGATTVGRPGGEVLIDSLPPRRRGEAWELERRHPSDAELAGLGEHGGSLWLRGRRIVLDARDPRGRWGPEADQLYLGVPVLIVARPSCSAMSFFDNSARSVVEVDEAGTTQLRFVRGGLVEHVALGAPRELLSWLALLTGMPAMPARWTLGYHQSRWGYRSSTDIRQVLKNFRELGVPLSAIHLDIDYMDRYRVFTVDELRFAELEALASEAAELGTRLVAIIDPGVAAEAGFSLYDEGRTGRMFVESPSGEPELGVAWPGRVAYPNFMSRRVRRWWAQHYERLTERGIRGAWHDMNEPTSISLVGDQTLRPDARLCPDEPAGDDGRCYEHAEVHNLYGLLMAEAGYAGLRLARPDERPFVLTRSGWAGVQRYAWCWTGDCETSWASLRQQVATLLGLALCGVPFAGADIGGFSGAPDAELYLRWLEASVCFPFCRTHSVLGVPPREPWRFPPEVRDRIVALVRFRYRLLPYLYTLAWEAAVSGVPPMRPVWFEDLESTCSMAAWRALATVDDAFLLGRHLLVAPVVVEGATRRRTVLPAGRWEPFFQGTEILAEYPVAGQEACGAAMDDRATAMGGGLEVELDAPLGRPVILVRRGAVVPLDDGYAEGGALAIHPTDATLGRGEHPRHARGAPATCEAGGDDEASGSDAARWAHAPRVLAFHCFLDEHGRAAGRCFDDAGDGAGPSRLDRLRVEPTAAGAVVRWTREGAFEAPGAVRVVVHGATPVAAKADGRVVDCAGGVVTAPVFDELELSFGSTAR